MSPDSNVEWLPVRVLKRLYNQKILTLAVFLFLLSLGCFVGAHYVEANKAALPPWLPYVPLHSLGDACFVAAMVGFAYEWIVRDESEQRLEQVLASLFGRQVTEVSSAVRDTLLTDPKMLSRLLGPEDRKRVIQSALQAELGDDQLGSEIYECSVKRAFNYTERWQNYRCAATLTNVEDPAASDEVKDKYFHCYYDIRYDTRLDARCLAFVCVPTIEQYNEFLADTSCEMVWLFPVPTGENYAAECGFAVSNVRVGPLHLNINRPADKNKDGGVYCLADHAELSKFVGKQVTVQYRIDVRVKKRGHLLTLNFVYPTKRISMEIDVAATDISYITARDFFSSDQRPVIRYLPSADNARKITVEIDEWVFPKGGVDFVWALKSERPTGHQRPASSSAVAPATASS